MSADQAEVVSQHMAIYLFAELSAKGAAAHATDESAKDCT